MYNNGERLKRTKACDCSAGGFYLDILDGKRVFVHLDYNGFPFNKTAYLTMLDEFTEFCDYLKSCGIPAIYAAVDTNPTRMRFPSLFGFKPIQALTNLEADNKPIQWFFERKL